MLYLEKSEETPLKVWGSYISWEENRAIVRRRNHILKEYFLCFRMMVQKYKPIIG